MDTLIAKDPFNGFDYDASPIIQLTPEEMHIGAMVGVMRSIEAMQRNGQHKWGKQKSDKDWHDDIEGALGEMALAKYLGMFWSKGHMTLPDVGNQEVRTTRYFTGYLCLHKEDHDDSPYWLLTGHKGKYRVRGWMFGWEAKQEKFWGTMKGQDNRPAYWVHQKLLNTEIPKGIEQQECLF